jgi:hypothetical protein
MGGLTSRGMMSIQQTLPMAFPLDTVRMGILSFPHGIALT